MSNTQYKKTGYAKGRPRNGEFRPPSPNAISQTAYQKKKKATDPNHKTALAIYQYLWTLENKDRQKEIKKNYRLRKAGWDNFIE